MVFHKSEASEKKASSKGAGASPDVSAAPIPESSISGGSVKAKLASSTPNIKIVINEYGSEKPKHNDAKVSEKILEL